MNRLDRRLTILRGKRKGAFDPDQYWFERARRDRLARRVRTRLRRMQPVILRTPRWSQPRQFLDDISSDLLVGSPPIACRTLDLAPLRGLTVHQTWSWLVAAVAEFTQVRMDGPAWQAVSRLGFRTVMRQLLDAAQDGPTRCLMLHHLQTMPVEALEDLLMVFEEHRSDIDEPPRFNLLLAGSIAPNHVQVDGSGAPMLLQDYGDDEAVNALVEQLGPLASHRLQSVVGHIGGIPAILDALVAAGESAVNSIVADPSRLWNVLTKLTPEIRQAFQIVRADQVLSNRLEAIARDGVQPLDVLADPPLEMAGLIHRLPNRRDQVAIRAPVFADLALAG